MKRLNSTLILSVWVLIIPCVAGYTDAEQSNLDAESYMSRGSTYFQKGQYDKAISDLTKAIEINTKLTGACMVRGQCYTEKGQYDRAIADYNKAIEIDPEDFATFLLRSQAYLQKGQYDKAICDANKAIEMKPNFAEPYMARGLIYMDGLKNEEKACSDWKRACDLGRCEFFKFAKISGKCE